MQCYKHRRVGFIAIVMDQVYYIRGFPVQFLFKPAPISLYVVWVQINKSWISRSEVQYHLWASFKVADFLASPQFFHLKCVKWSSNSEYTTYKPIQWILRKLQPFKDIKVRKSDLHCYEHVRVNHYTKLSSVRWWDYMDPDSCMNEFVQFI